MHLLTNKRYQSFSFPSSELSVCSFTLSRIVFDIRMKAINDSKWAKKSRYPMMRLRDTNNRPKMGEIIYAKAPCVAVHT